MSSSPRKRRSYFTFLEPAKGVEELQKILKDSDKNVRDLKDCAVVAVAVVTGLSYWDAHEALRMAGRRSGKGTSHTVTLETLATLGYRVEDVTGKFKGRTVRTLERELPCGPRFLVRVSRHILAVRRGEVIDWTKGRLHRVNQILEVKKES